MIHPTAIVDKNSKVSKNVEIGPYCIIGSDVEIGPNSKLHSHVSIKGKTKIGKNNEIFPFVSIGTSPQDLKYKGEKNSIVSEITINLENMLILIQVHYKAAQLLN